MKILIVNPSIPNPFGNHSAIEPPIWCGLYADYARERGHSVEIHDCQEKPLDMSQYNPDEIWLIAMGNNPSASSTPKMNLTLQMCRELKKKHKVKIGGLHPLALKEETEKVAEVLPMIEHIENYTISWDLLNMKIYRAHNWHCLHDLKHRDHYASLYTSYGCPYSCSFCNIKTLYTKWTPRNIKKVIEEMELLKYYYDIKNLKLCDELFTVNPKRIEELCEGMKDFKFNAWAYARVGTVNPKMLKQMKRAGVNWLAYGFESFNPTFNKNKKEDETIRMTKDAGINIIGNFIFGFPNDTEDSMNHTLEKAMEHLFEYVNFYVYIPYVGSSMWNESMLRDWDRYNQFSPHPIAHPKIVEFRNHAFKTYFSNPDYLNMIEKKFKRRE